MTFALALLVAWAAVVLSTVGLFRRALLDCWREPVITRPVVIFESDDWGPGEPSDGERLERVAELLGQYRDRAGRAPVMTLGVVLAIADLRSMARDVTVYRRVMLSDPRFSTILGAMRSGERKGVFALQLHGLEHYWPPSLTNAMRTDKRVRDWFAQEGVPRTELLPDCLQSRWADASVLPTRALSPDDVRSAVMEEAAAFADVFGRKARVAVPPTFLWSREVEAAWASAGIKVIVTPGFRYEGRDENGSLTRASVPIHNGARGASGMHYVVRDDYFEPRRGQKAEQAFAAVLRKSRAGRPTLLEMHRANFVGIAAEVDAAIAEVDRFLELLMRRVPEAGFMSTLELAEAMERSDPKIVESRPLVRLHYWLARLGEMPRIRKLAWLTGMMIPASILFVATRQNRVI